MTVPETKEVLKENHEDDINCGAYYGRCKWFSDKSGYGFISVENGEHKDKEIFVHFTGITPVNSTYKTLLCGEYVSLDIMEGQRGLQAVNVKGINGGPLMCDTNPNIKFIKPINHKLTQQSKENKENKENKEDKQDRVTEGILGTYDGICKWFNDTPGYGFIVITSGDSVGKDLFVHYSGITPVMSGYKTLVSGEYISFDTISGAKGIQAVNVTGYKGGPLICDVNHVPKTKPTLKFRSSSSKK